jgi:hypothetical protein
MDGAAENFPPTNPPFPVNGSEVVSAPSEDDAAAERQKYQRGGRKKNTTKSRMPPIPDSQIAPEPEYRNVREEVRAEREEKRINNGTTCPECAARKQKPAPKQRPPFETGIRSFNLKKAAGVQPIGVRTTTSESKKTKTKPAKKKKKLDSEVYESGNEEESPGEEEEVESEAGEREESKPMKIKLDLDLMIEIFLKAKIKGEVTITFL